MSETITIKKNLKFEKILFICLCILLSYPPFFRGLYFESELLPTHIFSFILGTMCIIVNFKDKEYKIIKTPIDIFALGVVFMYFISIIYGVNIRLAMLEALKYMNYFVIYILARDILDEKRKKIVFNALIASAFIVSVIGIGSAIGTWNYNGAFVAKRINSTFQYPNALASYLSAIFIITSSMILNEKSKILKGIYGFFSSIFMFTFILTYSRGMWIIFPFILFTYILLIPNNRKLETSIYALISIMVSIPLAFIFTRFLDGRTNICWIIFLGSGLLSAILIYIIANLEEKIRSVSIKKIFISLIIVFIGLVFFTLMAINTITSLTLENNTGEDKWTSYMREIGQINPNTDYKISINYNGKIKEENQYAGRIVILSMDEKEEGTTIKDIRLKNLDINEITQEFTTLENTESLKILLQNYYKDTSVSFNEVKILDRNNNLIKDIPLKYKYIPENIVTRVNSISLKESSAQGRLAFYNDSIKVIKDYLLFGAGGGGWNTLYKIYQSYGYYTTQAHNYYLQLWIEIGLVGLLLFIAFILLITYFTIKKYRQSEENHKIMIVGVYLAVLSILVHAFMDFNLSLSALTFILWSLLGTLSNENKIQYSFKYFNNRYFKSIFIGLLAVLTVFSASFMLGNSYANKGVRSLQDNKDLEGAIAYFERASKLYPYKSEFKIDLASMYINKYRNSKKKEDILRGREITDEALKLSQYESKYVSKLAGSYFNMGEFEKGLDLLDKSIKLHPMEVENYLEKSKIYLSLLGQIKDINKVKEVIERAYKIKDKINQTNEMALKPLKYNEELVKNLGFIQFYYENLGKNDYLIDKDDVLKFAYYFNLDIDNNGEIDKLRVWNSKKGNISYEFKREDNLYVRLKNLGTTSGVIYISNLRLKSNTNYKVYFKARGNVDNNTLKFYLIDNKSAKRNQGGLSKIELKEDWQIFSCEIKTSTDINADSPYLGFFHYGKDSGYVDVREVIVIEEK